MVCDHVLQAILNNEDIVGFDIPEYDKQRFVLCDQCLEKYRVGFDEIAANEFVRKNDIEDELNRYCSVCTSDWKQHHLKSK